MHNKKISYKHFKNIKYTQKIGSGIVLIESKNLKCTENNSEMNNEK